jgi:tetratricopeptide (TPR) repeat protein
MTAETGDSLASTQQEANSREDVLKALDAAAADIRERLGESLSSIERFATPIEQATTSSLEALQAFSKGNELRLEGREREALASYERAVQLDPNFAMAYARLGTVYANLRDLTRAAEYARKAYELRNRVSERERFYIDARYHSSRNESAELRRIYETWKQTYPRDTPPRNNLAVDYSESGDYERAIEEAKGAHDLDPANPFPYANLCWGYAALDRMDEAKAIAKKGIDTIPGYVELYQCLFMVAYLENDAAAMSAASAAANKLGYEASVLLMSIAVDFARGRLRAAEAKIPALQAMARAQGNPTLVADLMRGGARDSLLIGDKPRAASYAKNAVEAHRGSAGPWEMIPILILAGERSFASALKERLDKEPDNDPVYERIGDPLIKAIDLLARGEHAGAATGFASLETEERRLPVIALLHGQALLALGRVDDAVAAFQRTIRLGPREEPSVLRTVARIWLARAEARRGDTAAARREYQNVFAFWNDADPDIPILVEARKEYAALDTR